MAEAKISRVGILTSGGDCAGLNAAIRAVVKRAVHGFGAEVIGILDGTEGLLSDPPRTMPLTLDLFSGEILRSGGTMLGSVNRGNPLAYPAADGTFEDRSQAAVSALEGLNLDGLIGIGGDGSMRVLHKLMQMADLPFIGIPKTIDNDVPGTEFSIGFHTAVGVAAEALDRLQPTAASHKRVMILETMGRDAGHIALNAGIAGGADVILIPEIPYDIQKIAAKIKSVAEDEGRHHALVVCAEAVKPTDGEVVTNDQGGIRVYGGAGHRLGDEIFAATGASTRVTVLGHVQRGGQPSSFDRMLASAFGVRAVDLLASGATGRLTARFGGSISDVALADIAGRTEYVNLEGARIRTARGLGICLGD